jgi:hypothetical protein
LDRRFCCSPLAPLVIEAVDGNVLHMAELKQSRSSRAVVPRPTLPPGMRPGVVLGKFTTLHDTARRGDLRVIRSFASRPAHINVRDVGRAIPAAMATFRGQSATVIALAMLGASFILDDEVEATLVHLAVKRITSR